MIATLSIHPFTTLPLDPSSPSHQIRDKLRSCASSVGDDDDIDSGAVVRRLMGDQAFVAAEIDRFQELLRHAGERWGGCVRRLPTPHTFSTCKNSRTTVDTHTYDITSNSLARPTSLLPSRPVIYPLYPFVTLFSLSFCGTGAGSTRGAPPTCG